jgi:hypothetical protein
MGLFLVALGLAGCASTGATHIGLLRVAAEQVELQLPDASLTLRGRELEVDLRNLDGARVEIAGIRLGARRIRVVGYRVLDPGNGMHPYVGQLRVGQLGPTLVDEALGREFDVARPWPPELASLHGARVWLTGELVGLDLLQVSAFGIIRPPP